MQKKPEAVTHDDLWQEIGAVRTLALTLAGSAFLLGLAGFAWVAQVVQAATSEVAGAKSHVNATAESQKKVEERLDEIVRFLREDSREQREAMHEHIRQMHDPSAQGR